MLNNYDQIFDSPSIVPNLPVVDSQRVSDLPIYDEYEYDYDYDIDLIKQPAVGFLSENGSFRKLMTVCSPHIIISQFQMEKAMSLLKVIFCPFVLLHLNY